MITIRGIKDWFRKYQAGEQIDVDRSRPIPPLEVVLYTRPGCSLCVKAKDVIGRVRKDIPFVYREIDITCDPVLEGRYGTEIPVVFVCGRRAFKYRVDEDRLRKSLRSRMK